MPRSTIPAAEVQAGDHVSLNGGVGVVLATDNDGRDVTLKVLDVAGLTHTLALRLTHPVTVLRVG